MWQQWSVAISMARSPDGQTFICWWLWWVWWGNWQALPSASDNTSSNLPCCDVLCWKSRMQSYQSHQSSLGASPARLGSRTKLDQAGMGTGHRVDSSWTFCLNCWEEFEPGWICLRRNWVFEVQLLWTNSDQFGPVGMVCGQDILGCWTSLKQVY